MKTDNISDAVIIEEPTLHDRLKLATEEKPPQEKNVSFDWFPDESDEQENSTDQTNQTEKIENKNTEAQTNSTSSASTDKKPLNEKLYKESAETATFLIDQIYTIGFGIAANVKHNKQFTKEEKQIVAEKNMKYSSASSFTDEKEKLLFKKYQNEAELLKKRKEAFPLTDEETKRFNKAFEHFCKVKQVSIGPEWLLVLNLLVSTGDRFTELIMD
jgi:integrase